MVLKTAAAKLHRKGDIEIDKTLLILLGIIVLAIVVYFIVGLSTDTFSLYDSLFKPEVSGGSP